MEKRIDYVEIAARITTTNGMVLVEQFGTGAACVMPRHVAIATARSLLAAVAHLEQGDGSRQRVLPFQR